MLSTIANLTMATVRPSSEVVRQADSDAGTGQKTSVSVFIHPKALTFPVLVALVKGAWSALAILWAPLSSSVWFPFVACLTLGSL